jgi:two-component system, chemotaxis family, protein-glutamate methylesterase/glutaminase
MMSRPPVRVMIVEDSAVVRMLLVHIVMQDPQLTVAAAVASAEEALEQVGRVKPDVISMDIRLPGMDGLEATRRLMASHPTPIVVFADAVEDETLKISMNALKAGALTVIEKPTGLESATYAAVADTIRTQLRIMSEVPVIRRRDPSPARPPASARLGGANLHGIAKPGIIGIGASTGGPPALAGLLGALPADFPVPILVVQHMGASFMEGFASWLDGQTPLDVRVASGGEIAEPGNVYVAPGNRHLTLAHGGMLRISDAPPQQGQRPSADVLFDSMARSAGPSAFGILLTGMGEDGARGLLAVRQAGGYTITEDESTCVVYGMPAAAKRLGASRVSLPYSAIASFLLRVTQNGSR